MKITSATPLEAIAQAAGFELPEGSTTNGWEHVRTLLVLGSAPGQDLGEVSRAHWELLHDHLKAKSITAQRRSVRFNPISSVGNETDFVMNLLIQMANVEIGAPAIALAKNIALEVAASGGEVTLLRLVNAFEPHPELLPFATALRKNALPGLF